MCPRIISSLLNWVYFAQLPCLLLKLCCECHWYRQGQTPVWTGTRSSPPIQIPPAHLRRGRRHKQRTFRTPGGVLFITHNALGYKYPDIRHLYWNIGQYMSTIINGFVSALQEREASQLHVVYEVKDGSRSSVSSLLVVVIVAVMSYLTS